MRILVVNWQDITNPHAGGAEVNLFEVFSRIVQRGHSVTLFCSMYPGASPEDTLRGIHVIRDGSRNTFNFIVPGAYRNRFAAGKFDIVVEDLNKLPFFLPLYVKEPVYGIVHHLFGGSIFRETHPVAASYVYLFERLALFLYRRRHLPCIVVSPSTQQDMVAHGFDRDALPIVTNCVDHSRYRRTEVPKSPVPLVGYFGRLKKYKSVDVLLRALPRVLAAIPSTRAIIIGDGDDRSRLEQLARDLGLADVVRFTGFVSEEEKVRLLQEMWVKVATSSKEGWGLTVIEANACGTPVIASNVPGLRDAVHDGETGILFEYGNSAALTSQLISVLQDGELRNRLATTAILWAKEFDWDRAAERTLELFERRVKER